MVIPLVKKKLLEYKKEMEIYPLGHSSFRLKGKTGTVVTDPYDAGFVGLKFPKVENLNVVTLSHRHADHDCVAALGLTQFSGLERGTFIISGPGEYEIAGVSILGVPAYHDGKSGAERGGNVIYRITMDGVALCHLGDLGHKLSEEDRSRIGAVDVLFLPVGGAVTLNADAAAEVVAQLEPKIVIPMHYQRPGMAAGFAPLLPVEKFLKEMGAENTVPQPKLTVSAEKLPETTTVIVLE